MQTAERRWLYCVTQHFILSLAITRALLSDYPTEKLSPVNIYVGIMRHRGNGKSYFPLLPRLFAATPYLMKACSSSKFPLQTVKEFPRMHTACLAPAR
jgi:hypothetical protein